MICPPTPGHVAYPARHTSRARNVKLFVGAAGALGMMWRCQRPEPRQAHGPRAS